MGASAPIRTSMKVKIQTSIASADFAYAAREIVDIDADLAGKWIESGIAVALEAPAAIERTVAPAIETPESPASKPRKK